jgi:hypothetical protein
MTIGNKRLKISVWRQQPAITLYLSVQLGIKALLVVHTVALPLNLKSHGHLNKRLALTGRPYLAFFEASSQIEMLRCFVAQAPHECLADLAHCADALRLKQLWG